VIPPEQVPGHLTDLGPYLSLVCEAQVLDFSVRAGYGPWLKLRVENPESLVGLATGQRFHLLLVAIGDDEMPAAANPQDRKPYKQSQIAFLLCQDHQFWAFIKEQYGAACNDAHDAGNWLRESCGIESRAYLDSNPDAAETFKRIDTEYQAWKQQKEGANGRLPRRGTRPSPPDMARAVVVGGMACGRRGRHRRVHRKGVGRMTKAEEEFQTRVRGLGCIACRVMGIFGTPCDIHHILSGGRRIGEMQVLGLCPSHHRSELNTRHLVSRHPWRKEFETRYGTELELLERTRKLVNMRATA